MRKRVLLKIYNELMLIRAELHAIRSNMEFCDESVIINTEHTINSRSCEVRTNIDDHPVAEHTGTINAALNDLTSKRYRGV